MSETRRDSALSATFDVHEEEEDYDYDGDERQDDEFDVEETIDVILGELDDDLESYQNEELVKQALAKGLDLRQCSRRLDDDLRKIEKASIQDYAKESDNLSTLQSHINVCDGILSSLESMLTSFQGSIGTISEGIESTLALSDTIDVKLRNRKETSQRMTQFVEGLQVSSMPPLPTEILASPRLASPRLASPRLTTVEL